MLALDKFPACSTTSSLVECGSVTVRGCGCAHLAEGTTVMHEGFVNYNAGTLGRSMVEGRVSQGVIIGDGSDIGGGRPSWAP